MYEPVTLPVGLVRIWIPVLLGLGLGTLAARLAVRSPWVRRTVAAFGAALCAWGFGSVLFALVPALASGGVRPLAAVAVVLALVAFATVLRATLPVRALLWALVGLAALGCLYDLGYESWSVIAHGRLPRYSPLAWVIGALLVPAGFATLLGVARTFPESTAASPVL